MSDTIDDSVSIRSDLVIHANYELFVLAVVLIQFLNSIIYVFFTTPDGKSVILVVSLVISTFLLIDSFYRLFRSRGKSRWLFHYYGYLVFLGSLPVPFFTIFRFLQSWLALRKLKKDEFESARQIIVDQRAQNSLLLILIAGIVILETASILVLRAEAGAPDANILTAGDALWWTIVTMATVGYGDKYPVTPHGRVVGVLVISVGVGFFGVFTSYLAHSFLQSRQQKLVKKNLKPSNELSPSESLQEIKQLLDQYDSNNRIAADEIRSRLSELESRLIDKS